MMHWLRKDRPQPLADGEILPHLKGRFSFLDARATGVTLRTLAQLPAHAWTPAKVEDVYRAAVVIVPAVIRGADDVAVKKAVLAMVEVLAPDAATPEAQAAQRAEADAAAARFRSFHQPEPKAKPSRTGGGWPSFEGIAA